MLVLSRKRNERIHIGDGIVVIVKSVRGDKVKLAIQAPPDVRVDRHEIYEEKQQQQRDSKPIHKGGQS